MFTPKVPRVFQKSEPFVFEELR